jgi:hypothetical protein
VWAVDPAFTVLPDRPAQGSSEFKRWRRAHEVRATASSVRHRSRGALQFA